jgi:hypothetical protein
MSLSAPPRSALRSMATPEEIAAVWREICAQYPTQADVAVRSGIDPSYVTRGLRGMKLGAKLSARVAEGLGLSGELRRRWFAVNETADPAAGELVYEPLLDGELVDAIRGTRDLPEGDLAELRRVVLEEIRQAQRRRGVE